MTPRFHTVASDPVSSASSPAINEIPGDLPDPGRRNFIRSLGGLSAGALFAGVAYDELRAATAQIEGLTPLQVAGRESFWREIQNSFAVSRSVINLNNAGICPCPKIVVEAVERYLWEQEQVPAYTAFTTLGPRMERVRVDLAAVAGCDPEETAIVSNATAALQTILMGLPLERGDEVLTTAHDYWGMLDALGQRVRRDGILLKKVAVPMPPKSMDELVAIFEQGITPRTKLILVSHPVNLTGQLFPIRRICDMAHKRGIEVAVDAAQSFAQLDYKISDLNCDYLGTSLHKWIFGPKITGLLYVRKKHIEKLWPLLPANENQRADIRKFEAYGTQPAYALAIGEAITFHTTIGAKVKEERFRYLTHYWAKRLSANSRFRFYTSFEDEMSCAIATVGIDGMEPAKLNSTLWDKHRILVANPSRRVEGLSGVRVSPSLHTTLDELDRFCEVMEKLAAT